VPRYHLYQNVKRNEIISALLALTVDDKAGANAAKPAAVSAEPIDPCDVLDPSVFGASFIDRVRELRAYNEEHGDCLVPKRYAENTALGNFVNKQRQLYKKYSKGEKSSMTAERVEVLEELGFSWVVNPAHARKSKNKKLWREKFEGLKRYQKEHGNCRVDSSSELGSWVTTQRKEYRKHCRGEKSALCIEQIELLESVGFERTSAYEDLWSERVTQLKAYKLEHGDCMVPINYAPNPSLAQFVSVQRKNMNLLKRGKKAYGLTKERIKELTDIGFVWSHRDHNLQKWEEDH